MTDSIKEHIRCLRNPALLSSERHQERLKAATSLETLLARNEVLTTEVKRHEGVIDRHFERLQLEQFRTELLSAESRVAYLAGWSDYNGSRYATGALAYEAWKRNSDSGSPAITAVEAQDGP